MRDKRTVGLALGGGGVRGLAHVPSLEVIDECGVVPTRLAGTSMGAIIAALYASGRSGAAIREMIEHYIILPDEGLKGVYRKRDSVFKWLHAVSLAWSRSGLLKADGFLQELIEEIRVDTFEALKIPLQIVAADFYSGEQVVFDSGELSSAIKASMSIPGIFVPVEHEGRVLVDGGIVNNLPYDLLADSCDVTIAIDVSAIRGSEDTEPPNMLDATLGMFDLLQSQITGAKLASSPPTVYFRPGLKGIHILDFEKAEEVFHQAQEAMPDLREKLLGI